MNDVTAEAYFNDKDEEPVHYTLSARALWRAVITQAIKDATGGNSSHPAAAAARAPASAWFYSADFIDVCDLADLDPDKVRAFALNEIAAALPPASSETARRIEFNGQTLTIAEWARVTGIPNATIRNRLARGWPIDLTLTTPNRPGGTRLTRTPSTATATPSTPSDRGVSQNFNQSARTGGVPTTQDPTELEISL